MGRPIKFTAHEADRVPQIVAFERWDRERRRARPLAGLAFFQRTSSQRSINVASRHYPHLACWQWILSWNTAVADERRTLFQFHRTPSGWLCHLMWLGYLTYQTQNNDRSPASGPLGAGAPAIFRRSQP